LKSSKAKPVTKEVGKVEGAEAEKGKEPFKMTKSEWVERETEEKGKTQRGSLSLAKGGNLGHIEPQVQKALNKFHEWGIRTRSSAGYQYDTIGNKPPRGYTGITFEKGKISDDAMAAVRKTFSDVKISDNSISFNYEFKGHIGEAEKPINVKGPSEKWDKILKIIEPYVSYDKIVEQAVKENKPVPLTNIKSAGLTLKESDLSNVTTEINIMGKPQTLNINAAQAELTNKTSEYKKLINCITGLNTGA